MGYSYFRVIAVKFLVDVLAMAILIWHAYSQMWLSIGNTKILFISFV
jgi:hypothetical protein